LTNFKEKKRLFGPKKQAGTELKKKKDFFGPKIGGKIGYKGKKFTNFPKKKKRTFRAKK